MESDHDINKPMAEEDRLSKLPDEIIHKILSCFGMKFAVQTCLLSSRWKLLWPSMPCLNFTSWQFHTSSKFSKFVTHVLSRHDHQITLSLVKLNLLGADNEIVLRKIADYAYSHSVKELNVASCPRNHLVNYPPCLFSSQPLKHLTLTSYDYDPPCHSTLETTLDFPALTTLHLNGIVLCGDLFSKCVNLKQLTLEQFEGKDVEVFDIITPRLRNLKLINGTGKLVINVIAPELENLTIIYCSIKCLNAPPGLSSLCYKGINHPPLSKDQFNSLNKVALCLCVYPPPCKEEDARKIISMLQELWSARYITLDADMVECLSSFPDLLSHHQSPFCNLVSLTIDSSTRKKDAYKVKMSTEVKNFFLENSPSATVVME